jgi:hypothetical protein
MCTYKLCIYYPFIYIYVYIYVYIYIHTYSPGKGNVKGYPKKHPFPLLNTPQKPRSSWESTYVGPWNGGV